jgi:hypothetical protein
LTSIKEDKENKEDKKEEEELKQDPKLHYLLIKDNIPRKDPE